MISALSLDGFSPPELQQFQEALDAANRTISSPAFDAAVLAHTRHDESIGFDDTADDSQTVLNKIKAAFTAGIDVNFRIMNPTVKMIVFHTVASEQDGGVVFNRRRFLREDRPALADTIAHEAMHAISYSHPTAALKPTSVPYGVGAIVEELLRGQ